MACCCAEGGAKVAPVVEDEDGVPQQTDADRQHPDNKAVSLDPEFGGPCKKRRCTDCLCILLLIAVWVVMTAIGWAALGWIDSAHINKGNPWRLVNGIDYRGDVCGIDSGVKAKKKLYYMPDGQGVCVKKCPTSTKIEAFICRYNKQRELDAVQANDSYAEYLATGYDFVDDEVCSPVYKTKDVLNYCVAEAAVNFAEELAEADDGASEAITGVTGNSTSYDYDDEKKEWYEKVYGDIYLSMPYILGVGVGGALVVGFVYTFLLRIPGVLALIIWGLILAIFLLFLLSGLLCIQTSQKWNKESSPKAHSKSQADGVLYIGYSLLALAALWFCFICCMRKRIMLAIGIVKEAAKCIAQMPLIVLFPLVQVFALVIFLVPWLFYCLFLGSSGELKTKTTSAGSYKEMHYDKNTYYAGWYMLFSYFWTSEFIIAIGQIIIAMAVSTWYFTRDKGTVTSLTVFTSIKTSVWYHTGTAAFGSLVIAIIKTIRAIVAYVQKKAKRMKTCRYLVQVVLCTIQCCLWCIEKCMKFLNKNAYIQTAIFGYSFCKAARCAFFLILRNVARIMALGLVSGFVLLLGKIIISGGATFLCYLVLTNSSIEDDLSGIYVPLVLTFIIAYYVANMFNEVWGMAMDTILQCFVADEEMYNSDKEAMYAGSSLKSCVSNANKGKYQSKVTPATAEQAAAPKKKGDPTPVEPMP